MVGGQTKSDLLWWEGSGGLEPPKKMTCSPLYQKGIPMKCLAVLRQQIVNQKKETHPVKFYFSEQWLFYKISYHNYWQAKLRSFCKFRIFINMKLPKLIHLQNQWPEDTLVELSLRREPVEGRHVLWAPGVTQGSLNRLWPLLACNGH